MDAKQQIVEASETLGLQVTPSAIEQMLAYNRLLYKWNKAYNLTAIKTAEESIQRNLIDSLAIAPFIQETLIYDLGTGAGLPGVPLAIYFPQKLFVLVDSNGKKIRFINQVIRELGLENIETRHCRVEELTPNSQSFAIVSRAFASVQDTLDFTANMFSPAATLYLMKSKNIDQELADIASQSLCIDKIFYGKQYFDAERVLVKLNKN